jgi:hypothetical protein
VSLFVVVAVAVAAAVAVAVAVVAAVAASERVTYLALPEYATAHIMC